MIDSSSLTTNERKDAWTPEDDQVLADTCINHIRIGSTQLAAFDEVAERLGRTSAACGFRWNATVRKQCQERIAEAKRERLEARMAPARKQIQVASSTYQEAKQFLISSVSIDETINFLVRVKDLLLQKDNQIDALQKENEELRNQNSELKYELDNQEVKMSEDYKTFLQILGKAKELGI